MLLSLVLESCSSKKQENVHSILGPDTYPMIHAVISKSCNLLAMNVW